MWIKLYQLLADGPFPDPQRLGQAASDAQADPLVDKGGEVTVYIGAFLLIAGIAALVGVFSRRVEHAIFTAFGLSAVFMIFLLFINHSATR